MKLIWKLVAKVVSIPFVSNALIKQAKKTEYFHLDGYMDRYWLFNRYSEIGKPDVIPKRFKWLPSIRIHHILREDDARDLHDHPWNARTIILKGWYVERRRVKSSHGGYFTDDFVREAGDTATINFGEYHAIDAVSPGGVWTLFIAGDYLGTWGFLVNGVKVPWREYDKKVGE
jgi:hypothetical protein